MPSTISTRWTGGMAFDALVSGHHVLMDADPEWGGEDGGARPKALLLAAISGCSGMDVVSILNKMKLPEYQFQMDLEADSTSEHPVVYHTIRVWYRFQGESLPQEKIVKAVKLSTEKYCGVIAMLRKLPISISKL